MKLSAAQEALLAKIRNSDTVYCADMGQEPASAVVLERLGLIRIERVVGWYDQRRRNGNVDRIKTVALACRAV